MALDPLTAALEVGGKLLDKFFPNPAERAQAELELMRLKSSGELAELANETSLATAQMAINTEEAKSQSLFVSGWRPFVGWNCGFGLSYQFLVYPILVAYNKDIVSLDINTLITLLGGLLGLGSLRTLEKLRGRN
jgi:hypothetical protein